MSELIAFARSYGSSVRARALFDNYDEDLKQLLAGLKSKLEKDVKAVKGGE